MPDIDNIKKSQLKIEAIPIGRRPLLGGKQEADGWIGKPKNNLFQISKNGAVVTTTIDENSEHPDNIDWSTLDIDITTLGNPKDGIFIIRTAFLIKASLFDPEKNIESKELAQWREIQDIVESIKFNLNFFIKGKLNGTCRLHKIYLSNSKSDIRDSIAEVEFDLDTDDKWKKQEKIISLNTADILSETLYTYIVMGYPEKDFSGRLSISF